MTMMKPIFESDDQRGGFTLLEVLIAMMILTISLIVIFQLFSGGLQSAKLSAGYTRAIFHARAKIEETLLADRLMVGETEGVIEEDYGWKLSIDPYESGEGSGVLSNAVETLFLVTVDIVWTDGQRERTFTIRTLQMAKGIGSDEEV